MAGRKDDERSTPRTAGSLGRLTRTALTVLGGALVTGLVAGLATWRHSRKPEVTWVTTATEVPTPTHE